MRLGDKLGPYEIRADRCRWNGAAALRPFASFAVRLTQAPLYPFTLCLAMAVVVGVLQNSSVFCVIFDIWLA
jgi:hypothetical protein